MSTASKFSNEKLEKISLINVLFYLIPVNQAKYFPYLNSSDLGADNEIAQSFQIKNSAAAKILSIFLPLRPIFHHLHFHCFKKIQFLYCFNYFNCRVDHWPVLILLIN